MLNRSTDKPVVGTFDDNEQGLGPSPPRNSSSGAPQHSIRFQLPVPDDFSDCISELHAIGRLQTEIEKSVTRVQSIVDTSFEPLPHPHAVSAQAVGIMPHLDSNFRHTIHTRRDTSTTATRQSDKDAGKHAFSREFIPKRSDSGFAVSPQPHFMHPKSNKMPSAASPVMNILESPAPHELSAISHVAFTRADQAVEKTESALNVSRRDTSIETSVLFATPAPPRDLSSANMQFSKNDSVKDQNSFRHSLQRDQSHQLQSSPSRVLGTSGSVLKTPFRALGTFTPELRGNDRPPAAVEMRGDSARKLQLKMQTMDAKNRDIDCLLAQFLKNKTQM
jgi:hypothetical protein